MGLIPSSNFILIIKTSLVYYDYRDFSTDVIVCCIFSSLATTLFCRVRIFHLHRLRLTDLFFILFCFISGSFNTLSVLPSPFGRSALVFLIYILFVPYLPFYAFFTVFLSFIVTSKVLT